MSNPDKKAKATCTVSFNGNEATCDSCAVDIVANKIHLNFLRYSIDIKDRKGHYVYPKRDKNLSLKNIGAKVDDYSYNVTTIRNGYVYIFFENKPNLFKEFEVNEYGTLTNIEHSGDVRKNGDSSSYYALDNDDEIWIAFSEYQWTLEYIEHIRNSEDGASLKKERMQKFSVKEWIDGGGKSEDAYNVDTIQAYFPLDDNVAKKNKAHKNTIDSWIDYEKEDSDKYFLDDPERKLEGSSNYHIVNGWRKHYDNIIGNENETKDTEGFFNVFFCLHDAIACADEIACNTEDLADTLRKIVSEVQFGSSHTSSRENSDDSDYFWLQMHSMALYSAFYSKGVNKNEQIKDLRDEMVPKEFIEKLLAVKERKKLRKIIDQSRASLLQIVDSDYYRLPLNDVLALEEDDLVLANKKICDHHQILRCAAHTIDMHLDVDSQGRTKGKVDEKINKEGRLPFTE